MVESKKVKPRPTPFEYEVVENIEPKTQVMRASMRYRKLRAYLNDLEPNRWLGFRVKVAEPEDLHVALERMRSAGRNWYEAANKRANDLDLISTAEVSEESPDEGYVFFKLSPFDDTDLNVIRERSKEK